MKNKLSLISLLISITALVVAVWFREQKTKPKELFDELQDIARRKGLKVNLENPYLDEDYKYKLETIQENEDMGLTAEVEKALALTKIVGDELKLGSPDLPYIFVNLLLGT